MYVKVTNDLASIVLCMDSIDVMVYSSLFMISVFVVMLVALCGLVGTVCYLWNKLKAVRALFYDCANVSNTGIILFHPDERFLLVNGFVRDLIDLFEEEEAPPLKQVLNYFFDHAVELDEKLEETLKVSAVMAGVDQFREVVRGRDGGLYLVEIKNTPAKKTVILLKGIDHLIAR